MLTREEVDTIVTKTEPITFEDGLRLIRYYIHDLKKVDVGPIRPPDNSFRLALFNRAIHVVITHYKPKAD